MSRHFWTFVRRGMGNARPRADTSGVLFGLALALVLLSVPLTGGRLSALADLRLRAPALALAAIALQVLVIEVVPDAPAWVDRGGHLASYVLLGAFAWANRRVPGVVLMAAGGALNALAIAANGGVMPATRWAVATAGIAGRAGFDNSAPVAHAHLAFLGDVFAVPAGFPAANVFSVGDVLLVAGVAVAVHRLCRRDAVAAPDPSA